MSYPQTPGYKGKPETGRDAARALAPTLGRRQQEALDGLREIGPATADEVGLHTSRHWYVVRPRFSELRDLFLIVDTGERKQTEFGGKTWVARIATPEEVEQARACQTAIAEAEQ